jgi:hypothetical protein
LPISLGMLPSIFKQLSSSSSTERIETFHEIKCIQSTKKFEFEDLPSFVSNPISLGIVPLIRVDSKIAFTVQRVQAGEINTIACFGVDLPRTRVPRLDNLPISVGIEPLICVFCRSNSSARWTRWHDWRRPHADSKVEKFLVQVSTYLNLTRIPALSEWFQILAFLSTKVCLTKKRYKIL